MPINLLRRDFRNELSFLEENTGYELVIDRKSPSTSKFNYPSKDSPYYSYTLPNRTVMKVTARDLWEYPRREIKPLNSGMTVIECGPGLGEFIPSIVRENATGEKGRVTPIFIDMANYEVMAEILTRVIEKEDIGERARKRLGELLSRCLIFLDSKKVERHQGDVRQVVKRKELQGRADLVVDLYGPIHYFYTASGVQVRDSILRLQRVLKTDGRIVCSPHKYSGRGGFN